LPFPFVCALRFAMPVRLRPCPSRSRILPALQLVRRDECRAAIEFAAPGTVAQKRL
jgi:hypothetical protein